VRLHSPSWRPKGLWQSESSICPIPLRTEKALLNTPMAPRPHLLFAFSITSWFLHLGGLGVFLVAIVDNSFIPLPGSLDVITIWFAAKHPHTWFFSGAMAVAGSVLGGYITYALSRAGGKEAMEKRVSKKAADKVIGRFERWGFGTVAVSAVLPPPFPMVPVMVAAGALQYPRHKFISAFALGRGVRFFLVAGLS
jgi:membrane protein YqaA with SNARE-associated domain